MSKARHDKLCIACDRAVALYAFAPCGYPHPVVCFGCRWAPGRWVAEARFRLNPRAVSSVLGGTNKTAQRLLARK